MVWRKSCFVAAILVLVSSIPLRADTHLIFPRVIFQKDHWIGVALANPTSTEATLTLTAYNLDGTLFTGSGVTNPTTQKIPAGSQKVALAWQLFSAASFTSSDTPTRLWMSVTSTTDGVTGFFLEGHDGSAGIPDYLAGSDLSGYGSDMAIPVIENVSPSVTELSLVNPDSAEANVTITFVGTDGTVIHIDSSDKPVVVPPLGGLQGALGDLFSTVDYTKVAAMRLHSDRPVHCYGSVFRRNEPSLVTIAGQNASLPAKSLQFPQLAEGGGYSTFVGIQNLSSSDILVTLTAYTSDGSLFSAPTVGTNPATTSIKAGGVLRASLKDLVHFSATGLETGWLKVETNTSSIIGYVEYSVGSTRALVPAQTTTYTRSYFSYQYLGSPYFTGLAVLNSSTLTSNVQVYSLDSLGVPIGVAQQILKPGQKKALIMQQWVPATTDNPKANGGAVLVQSDNPTTTTQLWGTQAFTALANISPQLVSNSYDPGGGVTKLVVTPPLAVVESGKTKLFTQTGSPEVTWSVEGGNPSFGTISTAGLYQAPAAAPAPHNIAIQATTPTGDRAAGATIDVVQRETLIGGLTLLTAVAYLNNLNRFFIAEQQVVSGEPTPKYAATANTRISEVSTAGSAASYTTITNDTISKMIPLVSGGRTYILMAGFDSGKIYRLRIDDGSKQLSTVFTGLNKPNSMALDAFTGDLLVSEQGGNQIRTVPSSTIVAEGSFQNESLAGKADTGKQLIPVTYPPKGVASNPCTGAVYYTLADGTLHEYQGNRDTLLMANLNQPGQIMVLFRVGFTCSDGLVIAVAEAGDIVLIFPGKILKVPFIDGLANLNDVTFFPEGNLFIPGGEAAVIIGEDWPLPGQSRVTIVRVGGIYQIISPVPPPQITLSGFAVPYQDPAGDTFATSNSQGLFAPDIVSIGSYGLGKQTPFGYVDPPFVEISITFSAAVAPASPSKPNSIRGSIYLNTGTTGVAVSKLNPYNPYFQTSGIGANFEVSLEREKLINLSTLAETDVKIRYWGSTVSLLIPNTINLSKTRAIVLVGNTTEFADVAPNSFVIDLNPGPSPVVP